MRIKIKLDTPGEWGECWLQTQYIGTKEEIYKVWLYPTTWSELYKDDGHLMIYDSKLIRPDLVQYVKDCEDFMNKHKTKMYERPLTTVQKACNFFRRLLSW